MEHHFLSLHRKPGAGLQNHGTSQGNMWTKNFQSEGLFREKKPGCGMGSSSAWYQSLSMAAGWGDWLTFFSSYYFIVSGLSVMGLRVEM